MITMDRFFSRIQSPQTQFNRPTTEVKLTQIDAFPGIAFLQKTTFLKQITTF